MCYLCEHLITKFSIHLVPVLYNSLHKLDSQTVMASCLPALEACIIYCVIHKWKHRVSTKKYRPFPLEETMYASSSPIITVIKEYVTSQYLPCLCL